MNIRLAIGLALVTLTGLGGCGAYGGMGMAPNAGVTTGGAQDVGLARNLVAAGRIPRPEAFVIEGLLGEHDIDINAPRCTAAAACSSPRRCPYRASGWPRRGSARSG